MASGTGASRPWSGAYDLQALRSLNVTVAPATEHVNAETHRTADLSNPKSVSKWSAALAFTTVTGGSTCANPFSESIKTLRCRELCNGPSLPDLINCPATWQVVKASTLILQSTGAACLESISGRPTILASHKLDGILRLQDRNSKKRSVRVDIRPSTAFPCRKRPSHMPSRANQDAVLPSSR
jgi:hypothetical protein